ncbi:helix-turn-helix domain-containing protein [Streptomyces sp. NPDC051907]|uniref:helix-turn-helix domain-containing protein n=1 Tax=Streptomyces sp. NPDC051907 TaxID=3155284 RepID=UPI0034185462
MPTLGYLVQELSELELRFVEGSSASFAQTKVAAMVVVSQEELLADRCDLAQPPGTLVLLALAAGGVKGAVAAAVDRMLSSLGRYKAAGLVVTARAHELHAYPAGTRAIAGRLRVPLLTTTAAPAAWQDLNHGIQQCRAQHAERQVDNLAGLLHRLPAQLADPKAMQGIAEWLASALEAQVLVSEPERGVLAAAPDTAPAQLARAVISQAVHPRPAQPDTHGTRVHTRLVSLAPATGAEAVLAVAARRPYDQADATLIQHAAKLLGLVDQAQREYETAAQSAREARAVAFQLLMSGEPVKARRVLASLAPGLLSADRARVYVIDCGSARQRAATARHCETAAAGQALVIRCPTVPRHVVVVEPVEAAASAAAGIACELQRFVLSPAGRQHRLGGSGRRPLAHVGSAYEEAVTALGITEHTVDPVVLALSETELVDLLDPVAARRWARSVLAPLKQLPPAQAEQLERTLPRALRFPHTAAARDLGVHRNTLTNRVTKAASLLGLDLALVRNKVTVSLALDVAALPAEPKDADAAADEQPGLAELLDVSPIRAWAEALLEPLRDERRDLVRTVQAWIEHETLATAAARALGISEVTVRDHLRTVGRLTGRDLAVFADVRDFTLALHICTGRPSIAPPSLVSA